MNSSCKNTMCWKWEIMREIVDDYYFNELSSFLHMEYVTFLCACVCDLWSYWLILYDGQAVGAWEQWRQKGERVLGRGWRRQEMRKSWLMLYRRKTERSAPNYKAGRNCIMPVLLATPVKKINYRKRGKYEQWIVNFQCKCKLPWSSGSRLNHIVDDEKFMCLCVMEGDMCVATDTLMICFL